MTAFRRFVFGIHEHSLDCFLVRRFRKPVCRVTSKSASANGYDNGSIIVTKGLVLLVLDDDRSNLFVDARTIKIVLQSNPVVKAQGVLEGSRIVLGDNIGHVTSSKKIKRLRALIDHVSELELTSLVLMGLTPSW